MAGPLLPETDVLPTNSIEDPDHWPDYELRNAYVHIPTEVTKITSLLCASEYHPVSVTGEVCLHPTPRWPSRKVGIAIENVRLFAYGQYADGEVAVWAAGKAGWFKLKPCRAYRAAYQEMLEAINTLYFIVDAYGEDRRSRKSKAGRADNMYRPADLFAKYAREVLRDAGAQDEAKESIYRHQDFLLSSMIAGKEGIDWQENPFYLHLKHSFPQEHDATKRRVLGPPAKKGAEMRRTTEQQSVGSNPMVNSLKRKRDQGLQNRASAELEIASADSNSTTLFAAKEPQDPSTVGRTSQGNSVPIWGPRRNSTASHAQVDFEESSEADSDVIVIPGPAISDSDDELARGGKRKSALRPKPSKDSKGHKRQVSTYGDKAADKFITSSTHPKIKCRNGAEPYGQDIRLGKLQTSGGSSKQKFDEGIDMPESPSNVPDGDGAQANEVDHIMRDLEIRLKHQPDPVQEDVWTCALDGCMHRVYVASRPESQKLIKEHYALHAFDDDERVQLIKELQVPSLPANHLMEKVRRTAKFEGFSGSTVTGSRFPPLTVVQRY